MITNYKIVKEHLAHELENKVNALLKEGWQLHGQIVCTGHVFVQALTFSPDINRDLERRR